MSDVDQRTYDDEVDYEEEEEDLLDEDIIEEVDDDDGMDGEIAEAGTTVPRWHVGCIPCRDGDIVSMHTITYVRVHT